MCSNIAAVITLRSHVTPNISQNTPQSAQGPGEMACKVQCCKWEEPAVMGNTGSCSNSYFARQIDLEFSDWLFGTLCVPSKQWVKQDRFAAAAATSE